MPKSKLLFKLDISGDGKRFMELHRALLTEQDKNMYIHVFTWAPLQISIGYNQNLPEELKTNWLKRGVRIIRRPTGGAAVLHLGDISVAIVSPREILPKKTKEAYHELTHLLAFAIENITHVKLKYTNPRDYRNTPQCFGSSTGYELATNTGKAIGIALRATKAKLLLHASIRTAPHPEWFMEEKEEGWLEGITPQATLHSLITTIQNHYQLYLGGIFNVQL